MSKPILLYSTNSRLALWIAEEYYKGVHYVWCTPNFSMAVAQRRGSFITPTSCPHNIYHNLYDEVIAGDLHSSKIREIRTGLLKGVDVKLSDKVISAEQAHGLRAMIMDAPVNDFYPLLYIIPYKPVAGIVQEVPIEERANPKSEEYRITHLKNRYFDVIELRRDR